MFCFCSSKIPRRSLLICVCSHLLLLLCTHKRKLRYIQLSISWRCLLTLRTQIGHRELVTESNAFQYLVLLMYNLWLVYNPLCLTSPSWRSSLIMTLTVNHSPASLLQPKSKWPRLRTFKPLNLPQLVALKMALQVRAASPFVRGRRKKDEA